MSVVPWRKELRTPLEGEAPVPADVPVHASRVSHAQERAWVSAQSLGMSLGPALRLWGHHFPSLNHRLTCEQGLD